MARSVLGRAGHAHGARPLARILRKGGQELVKLALPELGAGGVIAIPLPSVGDRRDVLLLASASAIPGGNAVRRYLTIAGQAGLAQENLRLADRARMAGVLEERQRLAREIHDTVAQGLTSMVMQLEALEAAMPSGGQQAMERLDHAKRAARGGLFDVRHAVAALRPELLEEAAFPEAVAATVGSWSAETGIAATTEVTGTIVRLSPDVEATLLRTVQEALANVRKHAAASSVAITLSYMPARSRSTSRTAGSALTPPASAAARPAPAVGSGCLGCGSGWLAPAGTWSWKALPDMGRRSSQPCR